MALNKFLVISTKKIKSAASVFVPDEPLPSFGDSAKLLPPKDC